MEPLVRSDPWIADVERLGNPEIVYVLHVFNQVFMFLKDGQSASVLPAPLKWKTFPCRVSENRPLLVHQGATFFSRRTLVIQG